MLVSRRGLVLAAAFSLAPTASGHARELVRHPGFRAWQPPVRPGLKIPLEAEVDTGDARISLGAWMARRPAVLSLWASWCGPCLVEKPYQAEMSDRLVAAGARLRFLAIQAFDEISLEDGRSRLKKLKAETMTNARASLAAEKTFVRLFGQSPVEAHRTSMPALLLVGGDRQILGGAIGMMPSIEGKDSYWADDTTFDFLTAI